MHHVLCAARPLSRPAIEMPRKLEEPDIIGNLHGLSFLAMTGGSRGVVKTGLSSRSCHKAPHFSRPNLNTARNALFLSH